MRAVTPQFLYTLETILFASVIFMHLTRKNSTAIFLYVTQSLVVAATLLLSAFQEASWLLIAVGLVTFLVKVIVAPYFFSGLIQKRRLQFSVSTYLNGPLTLIILALLTAFSYSRLFRPLSILAPQNQGSLLLAIGMMFSSLFLIINRKGILSQMIGILSLENAIVSFAYVAGLEATAGLQVGILFDILVWIVMATVFATMIYRHFGSLDASTMKNLKEK